MANKRFEKPPISSVSELRERGVNLEQASNTIGYDIGNQLAKRLAIHYSDELSSLETIAPHDLENKLRQLKNLHEHIISAFKHLEDFGSNQVFSGNEESEQVIRFNTISSFEDLIESLKMEGELKTAKTIENIRDKARSIIDKHNRDGHNLGRFNR